MLYAGGYAWLVADLHSPLGELPPPQRLLLLSSILRRFMRTNLVYIILFTTAWILLYPIEVASTSAFGILMELIAAVLIIVLSVTTQIVTSRNLNPTGVQEIKSVDGNLKWLTSPNIHSKFKVVRVINVLSVASLSVASLLIILELSAIG